MSKVKLAIFIPSTFDDYPFLEDLLNKKLDDIGFIISNNSGNKLPEKYAFEKGIPILLYPIGKHLNVLQANEKMIKAADRILILDNGQSENKEVARKKCVGCNKPYKLIEVPKESRDKAIVEELKDFFDTFEKSKYDDLGEWLQMKRTVGKLEKIKEKL